MKDLFTKLLRPKYFSFIIIVCVLSLTSMIKTECPVCNGTGILKATPGMENVTITKIDSELMSAIFNGCDMYILYNFELDITFKNTNLHDVEGWVKTTLIARDLDLVLDFQYIPVSIPSAIMIDQPYIMTATYSIWYQSQIESAEWVIVKTEVVNEDVEDATCKGSGKVSLNMVPIISALEDKLREEGEIVIPYQPPAWYVPSFE